MIKTTKGITLVYLIITISVLLVLATVSVGTIQGYRFYRQGKRSKFQS